MKHEHDDRKPFGARYHANGTVTVWDVYRQGWVTATRVDDLRDEVYASLSHAESDSVRAHLGRLSRPKAKKQEPKPVRVRGR